MSITASRVTESTKQLMSFASNKGVSLMSAKIELTKMTNSVAKIFLVNGICLTSPIVASDEKYVLLHDRLGGYNLVNADAISTIQALDSTDARVKPLPANVNILAESMKELQQSSVHVFLLNGVRLDGNIAHIDGECILLEPIRAGGATQIIKWASVASIQRYNETSSDYRQRN